MIPRHRLLAAGALFAFFLATGPKAADFATAASAFDGGDYATAYRQWRALAETGDTQAQVALAGLYRGGIGRAIDSLVNALSMSCGAPVALCCRVAAEALQDRLKFS